MSLNNVMPWWFIELDSILFKCEKCLPEERQTVYREAIDKFKNNENIPKGISEMWIKRLEYGYTWDVPRKSK